MPSPEAWNRMLQPGIRAEPAYGAVEREARTLLELHKSSMAPLSTKQLAELLYPQQLATTEEAMAARDRLFKALQALSVRGLSDCATRGKERKNSFGKLIRPWLWHAPGARNPEAISEQKTTDWSRPCWIITWDQEDPAGITEHAAIVMSPQEANQLRNLLDQLVDVRDTTFRLTTLREALK